VKHRVVTTDYADDGTPILDHHDAVTASTRHAETLSG